MLRRPSLRPHPLLGPVPAGSTTGAHSSGLCILLSVKACHSRPPFAAADCAAVSKSEHDCEGHSLAAHLPVMPDMMRNSMVHGFSDCHLSWNGETGPCTGGLTFLVGWAGVPSSVRPLKVGCSISAGASATPSSAIGSVWIVAAATCCAACAGASKLRLIIGAATRGMESSTSNFQYLQDGRQAYLSF